MDKLEADIIQKRALKALNAEFGEGSVTGAGGTIGEKLMLKFTIAPGGAEERAAKAKAYWDSYCALVHPSLTPDHFGRRFVFKGAIYTINELQPNKPKYAIGAARRDGKQFGFPVESVLRLATA